MPAPARWATNWGKTYDQRSPVIPARRIAATVRGHPAAAFPPAVAACTAAQSDRRVRDGAHPLLDAVTRRFLGPLRRVVPTLGSVDLSPLLLFIICQLLVIVPIGMLERIAFSLI
ncbi:MAG: YggT family protein [Nitrosomonadales bacterium]|nr:YggT family protein [Nitrosomonadales bacterium]